MLSMFSNPNGCILPEWLFPFMRKHNSVLKAIEICADYVNGEPTPNVSDIILTFSNVSEGELVKKLNHKGSYFFSDGDIIVCGYEEE